MPFKTTFTLRGLVLHNISVISGDPEETLDDDNRLRFDLGMTEAQRKALAPGFQKIARAFSWNAIVGTTACAKLTTVAKAVDLVKTAAKQTDANVPVPSSRQFLASSAKQGVENGEG